MVNENTIVQGKGIPDSPIEIARAELDRTERTLLPEVYARLRALGSEMDKTTSILMDSIEITNAARTADLTTSVDIDHLAYTVDPTGLAYIQSRSLDAAREELNAATSLGLVKIESSLSEPLTPAELASLKIETGQFVGVFHLLDRKDAQSTESKLGCQDSLHTLRTEEAIICAVSDGASGVPLSAYGSELLVKAATLRAAELLQELKPESLLEPEFRARLHDALYLDLLRYFNALGVDCETANANIFGATLDITIVTQEEKITLSLSDGLKIDSEEASSISKVTKRNEAVPSRYSYPPILATLLVADAEQKLPGQYNDLKGQDGKTPLVEILADEAQAFKIVSYGSARSILAGESIGAGTDGLVFTDFQKLSDKVASVPFREWTKKYGEGAELATALFLVALNIEEDRDALVGSCQQIGGFLKRNYFYDGRVISEVLCKESDELRLVINAALRPAIAKLGNTLFECSKEPLSPSARSSFMKKFYDAIPLPQDPEAQRSFVFSGIAPKWDQFLKYYDIDDASSAFSAARHELSAPGRKKALEMLKRDFGFDPEEKPLLPPFDDASYYRIHN